MQKKANPIKKADFRGRKTKDVGMFFFWSKMKSILYPHLPITKVSKILTESSLVETKQTLGSIITNCICGSEGFPTISSPFFPFNTPNLIFFSDALNFLYGAMSESVYLSFTLMLFFDIWTLLVFGVLWSPRSRRNPVK